MNIFNIFRSNKEKIIKRKLANGLTEVKEFYKNKQIYRHYFLNDNGKLYGECKWWFSNGVLSASCNFVNGLQYGECKWWYNYGKLKEQSNYKNGQLHGERKWWWSDGTLCDYELYEDGKLIKDYLL